ncbi:hypothetical protein JHK86_007234 [Glycine max]|nr:hypothetical protein JHK86_007234 [Glycine max]
MPPTNDVAFVSRVCRRRKFVRSVCSMCEPIRCKTINRLKSQLVRSEKHRTTEFQFRATNLRKKRKRIEGKEKKGSRFEFGIWKLKLTND